MPDFDYEANLEARANFFKALGHPTRLLMVNLIRNKPRHGEELAAILGLNPATVSHHLAKLNDVGLLRSAKDQYYVTYSLVEERLDPSLRSIVCMPQKGLTATTDEDAYRAKVLKTFFRHGRLTQFPAQRKKQLVILERLSKEFEPKKEYSELQVNQVLLEFNEDVATLRRGMIDHKLMRREAGVYQLCTSHQEGKPS